LREGSDAVGAGSVANRQAWHKTPLTSSASSSQLAELLKRPQLGPELTFADHVHDLDPCCGRSGWREAVLSQTSMV